jgi:hypothetical protein
MLVPFGAPIVAWPKQARRVPQAMLAGLSSAEVVALARPLPVTMPPLPSPSVSASGSLPMPGAPSTFNIHFF